MDIAQSNTPPKKEREVVKTTWKPSIYNLNVMKDKAGTVAVAVAWRNVGGDVSYGVR